MLVEGCSPVVVVRFEPSGRETRVCAGVLLRDAVVQARLPLGRTCDGAALCGTCRVHVVAGEGNLSPVDEPERRLLRERGAEPDERLACCARVTGGVTVSTGYW